MTPTTPLPHPPTHPHARTAPGTRRLRPCARHISTCLGLMLSAASCLAQTLLPPLPSTVTGTLTLNMKANAHYDNQYFFDRSTDGRVLDRQLLAQTSTSYESGGAIVATSFHQAASNATVSPTSIKLYSQSIANAQTWTGGGPYSSFATAANQASASTPFIVQGGGVPGSAGTLVATLFVSGSVTVDPYFSNSANLARQYGRAYMYFWASGLNASGCTYYVDAGCLDITRGYPADTINSNNALRPWTLNIPFTFGNLSSFDLQMWTFADSFVIAGVHGDLRQHRSESDFAHTLNWGGIQAVLDDQGRPVTGWGISTLPGLDLTVAAIPEPGTWARWLTGLAGLVAVVRIAQRRGGAGQNGGDVQEACHPHKPCCVRSGATSLINATA